MAVRLIKLWPIKIWNSKAHVPKNLKLKSRSIGPLKFNDSLFNKTKEPLPSVIWSLLKHWIGKDKNSDFWVRFMKFQTLKYILRAGLVMMVCGKWLSTKTYFSPLEPKPSSGGGIESRGRKQIVPWIFSQVVFNKLSIFLHHLNCDLERDLWIKLPELLNALIRKYW